MIFLLGSAGQSAEKSDPFPYPVSTTTLENGMTIILSEDYSLPVVSVVVAYKVGSYHDNPRQYGLAYILENLMFQGSRNIGRMQHVKFISRVGGDFNAFTSYDRTFYHQTLPSNQLALVLWLESDRMYSLRITPAKVELAKRMIRSDIQRRKTLDPYLTSSNQFDRLLYPDPSYSHPIFGIETHLPNITTQDVWDFYRTYYTPSNAILCITGHFDKEKVIRMIQRYFRSEKEAEILNRASLSFQPPDTNIVYKESASISSPCFFLGYRLVDLFPTDRYALQFIDFSLVKGEGSRLQKRLITRERVASFLDGGVEVRKDLKTFRMFVIPNSEQIRERCQRILFSEINRLRSSLLSEQEFIRANNMLRSHILSQITSSSARALFLVNSLIDFGLEMDLDIELNNLFEINRSDILGAASRHLSQPHIRLDVQVK